MLACGAKATMGEATSRFSLRSYARRGWTHVFSDNGSGWRTDGGEEGSAAIGACLSVVESWLVGAKGASRSAGFLMAVRSRLAVSSDCAKGIKGDSAAFGSRSIVPSCRVEQAEGDPISIKSSMALGS